MYCKSLFPHGILRGAESYSTCSLGSVDFTTLLIQSACCLNVQGETASYHESGSKNKKSHCSLIGRFFKSLRCFLPCIYIHISLSLYIIRIISKDPYLVLFRWSTSWRWRLLATWMRPASSPPLLPWLLAMFSPLWESGLPSPLWNSRTR